MVNILMHIARAFSTSSRHAKQALYDPYIAPLNQEQKKALRKLMMASNPQQHSRFNKDVESMLNAYSVSNYTMQKRRNTLQRIKHIIRSAFGAEYSVLDRSLSQYSRDFEYAPLELTITDETRPTGFPPDHIGPQFPDAYNHEAIAKLLQQHGYSGSFVAGDAMRNQPMNPEGELSRTASVPPVEHGPYPNTHPWPTFTPYPTPYLTYPPVLLVDPDPGDSHTMSFSLSPPVPTHAPLVRLLRAYTSMGDHFRDMITFVFMWTRSIGMTELTPTCVALMVIGWLQHQKYISSLQNPSNTNDIKQLAERDDGVWFTRGHPVRGHTDSAFSSTWLETGFVTRSVGKSRKKIWAMLHDFFSFWSVRGDETFVSSAQYISVREGSVMRRDQKMHTNNRIVLMRDDEAIAKGFVPSFNDQPTMWQSQPIVIQDPFVPSFNHAHAISRSAGTYFHHNCSLSVRTMAHSHPMTAIIGNNLPRPPRESRMPSVRTYSTAPISQEIIQMYKASIPPRQVLDSRKVLISRVQNAISKRFGNGYTVECFGSTRYGVSTATSDLDLIIIDQKNNNGFPSKVPNQHLPDVYNVRAVARTLTNNGFVDMVVISKAVVPIVKFRDPMSNLDCDLNINEQLGLWNTRLIAQYCELAPDLLRPLIMVIKRWAKSHGLNDASGMSGPATFSSYSLVLMIIGYLQVKGALPSLQAGLDPLPDDGNQGIFWLRSKVGRSTRCDIRFNTRHDWTPQVRLSVEEAFSGWFRFWADEFQYQAHILSIREGHFIRRHTRNRSTAEAQVTEGIANPEIHQLRREADEFAASSAFTEQHEDDEGNDAGDVEDEEDIRTTAQGEASKHVTDTKRPHEGPGHIPEQFDAMEGFSTEEHINEEPMTSSPLVDTDERASNFEAEQPSKWRNDALVIADPFILSKNVCGNIGKAVFSRFRAECQRCTQMLEYGVDLEGLMGEIDLSSRQRPGRWGGRMRGRGRGRGKGKGRGMGGRGAGQTEDAFHANHEQGSGQANTPGGRGWRPQRSAMEA